MTTPDPIRTYLGMNGDVPPNVLLGLTPDAMNDPGRIRAALAVRLGQIDRHPKSDAPEADLARARLEAVAEQIINQLNGPDGAPVGRKTPVRPPSRQPVSPRRPTRERPAGESPERPISPAAAPARASSGSDGTRGPIRPSRKQTGSRPASPQRPASPAVKLALTPFDRDVLSVLISCRGWNAASRARLVALAGDRGVSGIGLLKVVKGLANHARQHGARLALSEIAGESSGPLFVPRSRLAELQPAGKIPGPRRDTADLLREQHRRRMLGITAAITVVAAAVFLALSLITIALFDFGGDGGQDRQSSGRDASAVDGSSRETDAGGAARRTPAARLAEWPDYPTFRGNAVPSASAEAADAAASLVQSLDQRGRELAITDEPSERVFRLWDADLEQAGTGWFLIDRSTRAEIRRELILALHETAGNPSVSDRLLDSLRIAPGRIDEPTEVWRNAFRAGMLADIRTTSTLPEAVRDRASLQLRSALPPERYPTPTSFETGVQAMLASEIETLVPATMTSENYADLWEMWRAAVRSLAASLSPDAERALLLQAAERILAESTDLARPGPMANVLGRMVEEVGPWDEPEPLQWLEGLFRDDHRITSDDLWVLTSLMIESERTPWLSSRHVLPPGEGLAFRNRIRDAIVQAWPRALREESELEDPTQPKVFVSADHLAHWSRLLDAVDVASPPRSDEEQWRRLAIMAQLGEAASLLANGSTIDAVDLMDEIEFALTGREPDADDDDGAPPSAPASPSIRPAAPGPGTPPSARPGRRNPTIPLPPSSNPGQRPPPTGRPSAAHGADGAWAAQYDDARPNAEAQLRLLRALRSSGGGDLGPRDAEVFVRAAYLGSPEAVRSLAREITIEQFSSGRNIVTEMLDQFPLAPRSESTAELIHGVTSRIVPFSPTDRWSAAARLALVEHLLYLWGADETDVDALAEALASCYLRRAVLLGKGPSTTSAEADPERAAARLAAAWQTLSRQADFLSDGPFGGLADIQQRQRVRERLARGAVQRIVAHRVTAIEHHAHLMVVRWPTLRNDIVGAVHEGLDLRRSARDIMAQAIATERGSLALWLIELRARLDRSTEEPAA